MNINPRTGKGDSRYWLRFQWLWVLVAVLCAPAALAGEEYHLGGADTITISVYEQQDLSVDARISQDDGTISYPLLGKVKLGGLTPRQAGARIARLLKQGEFLKFPEVTVTVKEFQSQKIAVMGQINHPGEYPLKGESRVVDLIAQAGGLKPGAADEIVVVKNDHGKQVKHKIDLLKFYAGDMSQNIQVSEGDFILVPKMDTFYIHGEVKHSGSFRLERGMTVVQAVSVGGGVTGRGSLSRIVVTRRKPDGKTEDLDVKLTDLLKPDDVIYVKERIF